jgi:hypothetical protein
MEALSEGILANEEMRLSPTPKQTTQNNTNQIDTCILNAEF